jgi:uracil-DNA glycosylase family 4
MEDHGSTVLLLFQAPGEKEWVHGRPVSSNERGSAGFRLEKAFAAAGKTRADFNITNAVQCFPGKKPVAAGERPRDRCPPALARRRCACWLLEDLKAHAYTRISVFGGEAKKSIRFLGLADDPRVRYFKHPAGGLSDAEILDAIGHSMRQPRTQQMPSD